MAEWAHPPRAILRYKEVAKEIDNSDFAEDARPFIRGGFFKNFLTKYPESNNMQKRMCRVSLKLRSAADAAAAGEKKITKAKLTRAHDRLMAAQCNCAYWHGLFGGLYLNYLRHAVYENLCAAEKIIDNEDLPTLDILDVNADGAEEVLVSTKPFTAYISPAEGGALYHLDIRDFNFCITNTLARTFEAYHKEAKRSLDIEEAEGDAPASIHDRMHIKEEGLLDLLTYDRDRRYSFIDRIFESRPTVEELAGESYEDLGGFSHGAYEVEKKSVGKDSVTVSLKKTGEVKISPEPFTLEIKKMYNVGVREPALDVSYTLRNLGSGEPTIYFAPELNFTLLGGEDPMRYVKYPGGEKVLLKQRETVDGIDRFSLVNEYDGFTVIVETTVDMTLLHFGVETASQSEGGIERTYQGTALLPVFPVTLPEGKKKNIGIKISVSKVKGGKKVERKGI
jgi:alpha-amylase